MNGWTNRPIYDRENNRADKEIRFKYLSCNSPYEHFTMATKGRILESSRDYEFLQMGKFYCCLSVSGCGIVISLSLTLTLSLSHSGLVKTVSKLSRPPHQRGHHAETGKHQSVAVETSNLPKITRVCRDGTRLSACRYLSKWCALRNGVFAG